MKTEKQGFQAFCGSAKFEILNSYLSMSSRFLNLWPAAYYIPSTCTAYHNIITQKMYHTVEQVRVLEYSGTSTTRKASQKPDVLLECYSIQYTVQVFGVNNLF